VGVSLAGVILVNAFTGYLLPWDQLSFWAVTISTGMLGYVPVMGPALLRIARGGLDVGADTLVVFYTIHTSIVPALLVVLMAFHFWRVRKAGGVVIPPARPGEASEVEPAPVMFLPHLLVREVSLALVIAALVVVLGAAFGAPLGAPANPGMSPNPTKAPWYFLGLQEMLVYFDPWIAGVVMPSIIMVGLMVFPYVDSNPLGNGYYTLKQRRFALLMFGWGFLMWILLIVIGTFIRGPGWIWFWPGQTWDHNAVVFDKNVDLHDMIATSAIGKTLHLGFLAHDPWKFLFGLIVVSGFFLVGALFFHWLMTVDFRRIRIFTLNPFKLNIRLFPKDEFEQKLLARHSLLQYLTFQFFAVSVLLALPVKLILRLALTIKYVWVTPWFNI